MKRRKLVEKMAMLTGVGMLAGSIRAIAGEPQAEQQTNALPGGEGVPVYDVKKMGAAADGKTDDGPVIQKAIDLCSSNGGGMVYLGKGTFLAGGIVLKDYVELHVSASAILLGAPEMKKFNEDHKFNHGAPVRSFIHADGAQRIAITGTGKINGNGHLFESGGSYEVRPFLIQLRGCTDVRIENILLENSAVWACWLLQCTRVRVTGIRIENPISPNRDGVDIDGCKDVIISDCNINTEDDSIAFKVSQKGFPCKDIVITNCILSSRCAAIRFGPDAIDNIENVTISNCVIRNTRLNGIKIQEAMGGVMRNITFSNIVMDNVRGPISIRVAGWKLNSNEPAPFEINDDNWENGKLQNILFDNIQATTPKDNICISITGTTKTRPEKITFSNIDFTFTGGGTAEQGARREVPDLDRHYPEMYIFGELPAYAFYMHHASGIVMNNVQLRLEADDLRPAIVCDDVDDLELQACKIAGSKRGESVIRLQNTKNVFINASRVTNATGTFVRVEGKESAEILLAGNRLNYAATPFEATREVSKTAVSSVNNT